MAEVEFPRPPQAMSSSCWSLGSNQYPSGRFPKVSIAIQVEKPKTDTGLNPTAPVDKPKTGKCLNLSQEKPREEKIKRLSQEISSGRGTPWISPKAVQKENLEPNLSESLLGKRKEVFQEGGAAGTSGLRLRLWEILGAGCENKDATDSPRIEKEEPVKKLSQKQNGIEKETTGTLKLSQNNLAKAKASRENPSSDPIETDSGSMKQAEMRRVTRSLTRTWATPQVTINLDSEKTEPVKKTEAYNVSFDEAEPKERGKRRKNQTEGSITSPKEASGVRKRAKIEPRRINFPKKPLISGKDPKETSPSERISPPSRERSASANVSYQREKTVSLNSEIKRRNFVQPKHDVRNPLRTPLPVHANQGDKEKEHTWEFPVTPNSTEGPQEKGILNFQIDRNQHKSVDRKPAFVKPITSFTAQRRKPGQKPLSSPTSKGEPQRKNDQIESAGRNTNVLDKSKMPPSVKIDTKVFTRSRKPAQLLVSPVTSNEMQSGKAASTNRSLSSDFKHSAFAKSNIDASTKGRKPIELVASPITSNEVHSEKESESPVVSNGMQAERKVGATKCISGNLKGAAFPVKSNVGASTQKDRFESMAVPVTRNDVQPEKNTRARSRSHDFNVRAFTQRKQVEFTVSPVTSGEVRPEKDGDSPLSDRAFTQRNQVEFTISPGTSGEVQPEKDGDCPLRDSDVSMSDYFKSPTFAMNGTRSSQRTKSTEEVSDQPRNAKTPESYKSMSDSGSDSDVQLSDDTRDSRVMSETKSPGVEVERDTGMPSHSTPEEVIKTKRSDANGFFKKGYTRTDKLFSSPKTPIELSSPVKTRTMTKALKKEVKRSTTELSPPTPIGSSGEESNGSEDIWNQFPDNSLASAVCQLATVLRKLKSKIKMQTNKKSFEILSVATEKIEKQLKDAELQMQEDTKKLIGSSKSKRKELESKFQGQAAKLKLIHDKFREEVNQHLMDCKSSLEEFDAFQMELKGTADKQKAQNRKLVRHVEQEIEAHLTDADAKITRVQKEAEKKMGGLKHVLREWIAEGAT